MPETRPLDSFETSDPIGGAAASLSHAGSVPGNNGSGEHRHAHELTWDELQSYGDIQYLIEPYLPRGALVNLSGYTGVGKTVLTTAMCIAAMSGIRFLGRFPVVTQGPVVYWDEETPKAYLKSRLTKMGFRREDPLHFYHFQDFRLDDDAGFEEIQASVERHKPALICFDTLIRFHSADENSAPEMSLVMKRLRRLANMGPCVLTQIHQNKGNGDSRYRSRGSSDIIGACDLELVLEQNSDGSLRLFSGKSRLASVDPVTLRIQEVENHLEVVLCEEQADAQIAAIDGVLTESAEPVSTIRLLDEVKKITKISIRTLRSILADNPEKYAHTPGPHSADLWSLATFETG